MVEGFFHGITPLTLGSIRKRSCMGSMIALHCCVNWIRGYSVRVCFVVLLDAFEASKRQPHAEKCSGCECCLPWLHLRTPSSDCLMMLPVGCFELRPQTNDHSTTRIGKRTA
jgi:hypothetical protein